MQLHVPPDATLVRTLPDGYLRRAPGVWHIQRAGRQSVAHCGDLLSGLYAVEQATISQAAGPLCRRCWPFSQGRAAHGDPTV
jgi:hypothetical protein